MVELCHCAIVSTPRHATPHHTTPQALVLLQNAPAGSIEKESLVMGGMKARKRLKAMGAWTAEFNTKYTAFVKAL